MTTPPSPSSGAPASQLTATAPPDGLDAAQWDQLEPLYRELIDRELKNAGNLEQLLLDRSELDAAVSEARARLYIGMTCRTDDEAIKEAYLAFVEEVDPQLQKVSFELDKKIAHCPHRDELDGARYEVLLRDVVADVELFREENVPLQTEDTKLGQQYSEIAGAMTVVFRGEERTLPMMAKHLEETDRSVREEAWRLVADRRLEDRDRLDEVFDRMVAVRDAIAKNAGCENYLEYAFKMKHRFDYTPGDCEAFHQAAAEHCVPVHRTFNAQRGEALGVAPLRPWDLAVDVKGRAPLRPFTGAEELIEGCSKLFHRMDDGLGELFERMRDGESLDLETRKGKAPGGYLESLDLSRKTFIFMNAAGMHGDLNTMIHESGHAFHAMMTRDEPLLHYRHAPLEFCEVASMGMELVAYPYLDQFYTAEEIARAKRQHLEAITRLIPWIATIDAFQHWIYAHPQHTRDERTAYWLELDERFGPAVSWEGLEAQREAQWQRQLHLFEVPFYYIEYGIAQLGALQLWKLARENEKDAVKRYRAALALGGSRPLPELFEAAGLTFDLSPGMMESLMAVVREELDALPA